MIGDADRWSIWYRRGDELCGVLTHNDDDAYERGQELLVRRVTFDEIDLPGDHRPTAVGVDQTGRRV